MSPKKGKTTKSSLKKAGTMVATAAVRKTDTSVFFPKVNIYLI
jgi:hypothetical protein